MITWLTSSAPERITIDLTNQCNLRCRYCCFFGNDVEKSGDDLSSADWIKFIEEAGSLGVMRIALRGGEVLIYPGFKEIVNSIIANRMRFSLQTNGALLTDGLAEFIAGTGRCDGVKLSIDGPEEIHDAQRGKGAFAGAVQALELLKKHHINVGCVMTVHKDNFPVFEACAEYLLDELEVPRLSFSLATAASGTPPHLALGADDFYDWVMRSRAVEQRYGKERFGRGGAAPVLSFWRGLQARSGRKPENVLYGHCAKMHTALSVRHDGAIVPCQKMSGCVLGVAGRDKLADVWNKSPELLKLRSFTEKPEYRKKCIDCPYREWCSAGCPAHPDIMEDCGIGCLKEYLRRGGEL